MVRLFLVTLGAIEPLFAARCSDGDLSVENVLTMLLSAFAYASKTFSIANHIVIRRPRRLTIRSGFEKSAKDETRRRFWNLKRDFPTFGTYIITDRQCSSFIVLAQLSAQDTDVSGCLHFERDRKDFSAGTFSVLER